MPIISNLIFKEMKSLKEIYGNNYVSIKSFDAEDTKKFKFGICVDVVDLNDACGEKGFLISVTAAKLPKYLSKDKLESIKSCLCETKINVFDVSDYGLCANIESKVLQTESEVEEYLNDIDNRVDAIGSFCGFYFDKIQNRVGNTGWDFLNGKIA